MFKMGFSKEIEEISGHELRDLQKRQNARSPNINRIFSIETTLDHGKLQVALQSLALRHEALRTRFVKSPTGAFERKVEHAPELTLISADLTDSHPSDEELKQFLHNIADAGFDAEDYPLFKAAAIVLDANCTILFFSVAEAIADGQAMTILIKELGMLYLQEEGQGTAKLQALNFQLSDFVASHNAWLKTSEYESVFGKLCLKLKRQTEARDGVRKILFSPKSNRSFFLERAMPEELNSQVHRVATVAGVSAATVLVACTAKSVLHHRKADGMFFTTTFSNRHIGGTTSLVGHLSTTVPSYLNLDSQEEPLIQMQRLHRDLFESMSQFGMVPIHDVSREFLKLYPPPLGSSLKFGKVVIDVVPQGLSSFFGFPTQKYVLSIPRTIGSDFKFEYRMGIRGGIGLCLRGLEEGENESMAQHFIETGLREELEAFLPQVEHIAVN